MKRDHFNQENDYSTGSSSGKGRMFCSEPDGRPNDGGDDELFAVLGYRVKQEDMVSVAQKMEQLEEVMGSIQEEDGQLSQLASETVHYNPSDISSWIESMISGLKPLPEFESSTSAHVQDPFIESSRMVAGSDFGSDLIAIPGKAVYSRIPSPPPSPPQKKLKIAPEPYSVNSGTVSWSFPNESTRQVVLVDSQENGIRLFHTLMACAGAVQQENMELADALVQSTGVLAVSQAGAMRNVASFFAEALARIIYKRHPTNPQDSAITDSLQMSFYAACPYLKFAHFAANQAILKAFAGKKRVHVIDFSMKQGMQWPPLLQALAVRPGGPPAFRLTGISPPSHDNTDHLQEVGWKLAELANKIEVEFEYKGFVASSLADLDASMLDIRDGETVAVNAIFELHQLLATPGAIERVLQVVQETKPEIVTVAEQEANHNGSSFLERFNESLHYYSAMFDSLESCVGDGAVNDENKVWSEVYLGRQICNVVACEGAERVERHETLDQWRSRLGSAGFKPVHLGSNAYHEASMVLALFGGDGYEVQENNGCLMVGWHTRPLIATSAWKPLSS